MSGSRLFALLALFLFATVSMAENDLGTIREALAEPINTLKNARQTEGAFVQEKRLHGFPQTLSSSGRFKQTRDQGLIWHTLKPIDSRLVLSSEGSSPGSQHMSEPAMQSVARLFNALFSLDLNQLDASFQIKLQSAPGDANWQLALKPRDAGLARIAQTLVVSGQQHIETVRFTGAEGDQTLIRLSDLETSDQVIVGP